MGLKNLGERIKYLRKQLGLTQEEFGEKLGIKGNTVTGYERGSRTPSESLINYICLVFNVNQTWLRTGEGVLFLDGSNVANPLSDLWTLYNCNNIEMDFLKGYFSLKKSDRTAFCKLLHEMFPNTIPEPQDVCLDDLDFQEVPELDVYAELEIAKRQNLKLQEQLEAVKKEKEYTEKIYSSDSAASDSDVDVLAELNEVKQQNRELLARMKAIEKEDENAETQKLQKVGKRSGS